MDDLASRQGTEPVPGVDAAAHPGPATSDGEIPSLTKLVVSGYILAVVLPLVGFVIGVVLVNRSDKREIRHGIWIIAVAVLAAFVLFVALIVSSHGAGSVSEASS